MRPPRYAPNAEAGRPETTREHAVWVLNICMTAAAFILHNTVVVHLDPVSGGIQVPWWTLAALFLVAEVFVIHVQFHRDSHSFSLSEIPLVLGLFFFAPAALVFVQLLGAGAALTLHRRQTPVKLAFNLSRWFFETTVAVALFQTILSFGDGLAPVGWIAAFVATFVLDGIAAAMIEVAISLSEKRRPMLPRMLTIGYAATFTNTTLALTAVTIISTDVSATWMIAVLSVGLFLAYRAYASVNHKHEALRALHESTRFDNRSMQLESVVLPLLDHAREMFRAEIAEATLFPSEGETSLRTRLGPDDHVDAMVAVVLDPTQGVWARVASEGQGVVVARPITSDRLREHFRSHNIKDAMFAPIRAESGIVGTIMVGNRLGDVSTFDDEDLSLFETLVNHASVSLENFRLVDTLRRQAAENEYQALHDGLTGLPNRTLFNDRVGQAIREGGREAGKTAIMILDLDRFKEVNDTLGHHSGDILLQEVGKRLLDTVREADTVARLGGDEFAILLPRVGGRENAVRIAEDILETLKLPFCLQDLTLDVGGSIGIANFPEHGEDAETLIQRADVAMYLAKSAHSGYELYQHERNQYTPRRLALVSELRNAIEQKELSVFYQPKAELGSGRIIGAEALVRWEHPRDGLISPDKFIPIAENTGLIKPLTMHVLDVALGQCRAWRLMGTPLKVAVNLSARNLLDIALPNDIQELLDKWDVPATSLQLEITESSIMADPVRTNGILSGLSAMGVGVAIDDFGTGYSSLSHLSTLPVDEIKIDKSFVLGMASDENAAVIVRSIIDLGRNLDLRVVAEGVETRSLWNRLASLGCDVAQGYLLSRPLPADRFDDWHVQYSYAVDRAGVLTP
ncbi:MAG: putative bifunctional diguanylate cyclase/phosphodiesterase [Actinomycetota bacterium]